MASGQAGLRHWSLRASGLGELRGLSFGQLWAMWTRQGRGPGDPQLFGVMGLSQPVTTLDGGRTRSVPSKQ